PGLSVSDAGEVNEGTNATFDVALDNPVDGSVDYTFTLGNTAVDTDKDATLSGDNADVNATLTVTYQKADGSSVTETINSGDTLSIPGDAKDIQVTVASEQDDTYEGDESFELNVSADIGDNKAALTDSGSAIISDDGNDNNDTTGPD
ncbi:hypothetical protein LRP50_25540, partial [Enterovibrio sp. ZSDZ42]